MDQKRDEQLKQVTKRPVRVQPEWLKPEAVDQFLKENDRDRFVLVP